MSKDVVFFFTYVIIMILGSDVMNDEEIILRLQRFLDIRLKEDGTINQLMDMKLHDYDIKQKRIRLSFPIHEWQLNPVKHMHGGLICTALDITMGCVAYVFSEALFTPTIQMSVNFVKSIKENDELIIEGICDHAGSRMAQVRAIAYVKEDLVASANGSYAVNTKQQ